ncbi:MAG: hypothetical protein IPM64_10555 [Phycisphaerales bacterium]|nr:hypothetical protein [Phycisphaerales bacterium]
MALLERPLEHAFPMPQPAQQVPARLTKLSLNAVEDVHRAPLAVGVVARERELLKPISDGDVAQRAPSASASSSMMPGFDCTGLSFSAFTLKSSAW